MLEILLEIFFKTVVYSRLIFAIFFPLRDPEKVVCKRLKYGPPALSKVEMDIYQATSNQIFTKWYEEIQPLALARSRIARDCYLITFSNNDKIRYLIPDLLTSEHNTVSDVKYITVYPIQGSIKVRRLDLIKVDIKKFIYEQSIQVIADMYDESVFWGDGVGKACGILNKTEVIDKRLVKCDTCDDLDGNSLLNHLPKMMNIISYTYQKDMKWYVGSGVADSVSQKSLLIAKGVYQQDSLYGLPLVVSDIMPNTIRHPYPVMIANLERAYCLVDKVDEFSVYGQREGQDIYYILKCNIGGEVIRPEAISVLNTLQVAK